MRAAGMRGQEQDDLGGQRDPVRRPDRDRLQRSLLIGAPVKPGPALLNTGDGILVTVAVPLD